MRFLLIFTFSCLLSTTAFAFTLITQHPHRFTNNEVLINVANNNCVNVGISKEDLLNISWEAAESFWNRVTTARISFKKGSLTTPSAADLDSAQKVSNYLVAVPTTTIHIACTSNYYDTFADSTLAVGGIATNNAHYIFVNDQPNSAFANLSRQDMVSTLAHEMGHALGLGHSPIPEALMYYSSKSGRERLEWDDWDGLSYLYPVEKVSDSCGTIKDVSNNDKNGLFSVLIGFMMSSLLALSIKRRR